ncbi:hypothetical protein LCGC14_2769670, partial [marine sediment metagenome]
MTAEPPIVSHQDNTENPTCVILAGKALDLLKGDRHRTHGDRYINHRNIATLWQAFLDNRAIKEECCVLKLSISPNAFSRTDFFLDSTDLFLWLALI